MSTAASVRALTEALVRRPSITPDEAGCLDLLATRLAAAGFELERLDADGVGNLWARRGRSRPLLAFAGHVDVVPTGPVEAWHSPPFEPVVRAGCLYGRGAADMKASLAAMVCAIERYLASHPDPAGSLAMLLTSDEEGAARHGTRHVVEVLARRGEVPDYCLIGEPTSVACLGDTLKNGRRGSLNGHLVVLGKQGHVAYPHLADNPVHRAAAALAELAATEWDAGDADFPPTSFQVSTLQAGTGAANVIPGQMEVRFNFRFSPRSPADTLRSRVHAILDRHGLRYRLDWALSGEPFLTPRGRLVEAVRAAITEVTGLTPELSTTGGTSDGRFIATICPEVVEFGPVNATIHQIDECIALDTLEPLAAIYGGVLERLLPDPLPEPTP